MIICKTCPTAISAKQTRESGLCDSCNFGYLLQPKDSDHSPDNSPSQASDNNGGSTDYYKFDKDWVECGDVIEAREMNYNQGNIFKAAFCFNQGRHTGTTDERELNKIIYFAKRQLALMHKK